MRIFEFQFNVESDWFAAETIIDAIRNYLTTSECDIDEIKDIVEIPESKWEEYKILDSDTDEPIQSFAEWIKENPDGGMIASTAY